MARIVRKLSQWLCTARRTRRDTGHAARFACPGQVRGPTSGDDNPWGRRWLGPPTSGILHTNNRSCRHGLSSGSTRATESFNLAPTNRSNSSRAALIRGSGPITTALIPWGPSAKSKGVTGISSRGGKRLCKFWETSERLLRKAG